MFAFLSSIITCFCLNYSFLSLLYHQRVQLRDRTSTSFPVIEEHGLTDFFHAIFYNSHAYMTTARFTTTLKILPGHPFLCV